MYQVKLDDYDDDEHNPIEAEDADLQPITDEPVGGAVAGVRTGAAAAAAVPPLS